MKRKILGIYATGLGILCISILGSDAYFATALHSSNLIASLLATAVFIALGSVTSRYRVLLTESSSHVIGATTHIAALIVLPYPFAILAIGISKLLSEVLIVVKDRRWKSLAINASSVVLATSVGGAAFHLLHGTSIWSSNLPYVLLGFTGLVAMGGGYYFIEVVVICIAIALSSQDSLFSLINRFFRQAFLPESSLILIGIVFGLLWHQNPILSLFVVVPVILSIRSFRSVATLRKETVEAVLEMAESIDIRDEGTGDHSKRLAAEAEKLARAVELLPETVAEIKMAARVHDLGKIAISNAILQKPGLLTAEERAIMEQHPVIGARILGGYSAFQNSVDIVMHHHERWDGAGYPTGLKGEEIPIGSRIIGIVDAFDAMTEDRPYRRGMSPSVAVGRLRDGMWSQFDPKICAAYIQLLVDAGIYTPSTTEEGLHLVTSDAAS